jgi:methyl-accepting chemotaxis protein-2 (aspartate sensor receptor)
MTRGTRAYLEQNMTLSKTKNQSVARRLSLLSLTGLTLVLLLVGIAIGIIEWRSVHGLMVKSVDERLKSIVAVADATERTNRQMTAANFSKFRKEFDPAPSYNKDAGEVLSFGVPVNGDFTAVDKFARDTGGVATVFARKGDDFVRVTTSLKKQDGERAIGTMLDRNHPAYKLVLSGQPYTGPAVLFGTPYMTHYDPIKEPSGQVVGIFFIGQNIALQLEALEKQINDTRFFESGGTYLLATSDQPADARFVVHATAKGKTVLEVDAKAGDFLNALIGQKDAYVPNALPLLNTAKDQRWALAHQVTDTKQWVVAEVSESEAMAQFWVNMGIIGSLLAATAVLLGVGLYWLIHRTVGQPLDELTAAITSVAQGDLTHNFHSDRRDEIGALVTETETMRTSYLQAMQQVRHAAESIGTASAEIAAGNQDLSNRTEQTASNLQSTASSMAQLTGTVQHSADSARQANQLAHNAAEVAARGGVVVGEVVTTMNEINQSSRKIADIIQVIDGIAFQTNILALNAAVEAARAGEQGRGFAVVASEVRSLAGRSAEAAREIKALIQASVNRVEAGSKLVANAGETMTEIVSSVRRVSDIIGEISTAAAEQSQGISNVNHAVGELDQMTQQNAALVEQSAAAAESLREQAQRLEQAVSVFKLNATGANQSKLQQLPSPKPVKAPAPRLTARQPVARIAQKKFKAIGHTRT